MDINTCKDAAAVLTTPGSAQDELAGRGGHKWYVLALLVLIYVVNMVDRTVISITAEPLKAEFHLSDKQIGLLPMAFSVTFGLFVLPMGWLADRVDRRALLSAAAATWSLLTAVCAFSSSFGMLIAARMGVGAGETPSGPASLSLVADLFPLRLRNTAVGIYSSGAHIGQLVMFLCGGWLLMHFDWRAVFLIAGGPGLVLAALLYFTTREPVRGTFDIRRDEATTNGAMASRVSAKGAFRTILANPALCYTISALALGVGFTYSVLVWATSFLSRIQGVAVGQGAIWTGLGFGLCALIGSVIIGPLADRFSKGDPHKLAFIPAGSTLMAGIGGTIMVLGETLPISLAGLALLALMTGIFYTTSYSSILSLSAPEQRGATLAATKLISTLVGEGPVPLFTGAISDAIGGPASIRTALLCTMAFSLVAAFCHFRAYKIISRRNRGCSAS